MILTIKCYTDRCRSTISEDVEPGFSIGPIIKRHGWAAAPSGYFCPDCQGAIPAADYALMNEADRQVGN